jgi:hypothetical protein
VNATGAYGGLADSSPVQSKDFEQLEMDWAPSKQSPAMVEPFDVSNSDDAETGKTIEEASEKNKNKEPRLYWDLRYVRRKLSTKPTLTNVSLLALGIGLAIVMGIAVEIYRSLTPTAHIMRTDLMKLDMLFREKFVYNQTLVDELKNLYGLKNSVGHWVPRYIPKGYGEWVPAQTAVPWVGTQIFEEYLGISEYVWVFVYKNGTNGISSN